MSKSIYYMTTDGIEVIDNTPQAESRLSSLDYLEERIRRERKRERNKKPLWKLASMCGIL